MNTIKYEEIASLLQTFKDLRNRCSENNNSAVNSLKSFFQSGFNFSNFQSSSDNLINRVNNSASILDQDYDRIINYLTKVAEKARATHNQQVSTLEATEIWKIQEDTRG